MNTMLFVIRWLSIRLKMFYSREDGASGIEYAIVATLVAVVLAGFSGPISTAVTDIFNEICTGIGASCGSSAPTTP